MTLKLAALTGVYTGVLATLLNYVNHGDLTTILVGGGSVGVTAAVATLAAAYTLNTMD